MNKETKHHKNGHHQENAADEQSNDNLTNEQRDVQGRAEGKANDANEQVKELQDKYLRLYSDFENFRKRANKEKIDLIHSANEKLLLELLPVYDDFERAVDSIGKIEDVQAVLDGFKFIFNKFKRVMEQSGLQEIDAIGTDFDPENHEAITKIPAPSADMRGKIVDQVQKGYTLNDKIIRHSKVVIGE